MTEGAGSSSFARADVSLLLGWAILPSGIGAKIDMTHIMFALKPFIELAIFALVMWAVLSVIYWICRGIDRHISGSYDWFII
jgi:hypothetical protein